MFRWLLSALLISAIGCGGAKPQTPTLIQGRVFYHGEPLSGGVIVFVPDEERGSSGEITMGIIQYDGHFVMENNLESPIPAGWHRISVAGPPTTDPQDSYFLQLYRHPPKKYRNPKTSGLIHEIKAGQVNTVELILEDH